MKKITLKHSLNGKIETRTTARAYTHVNVLRLNAAKYTRYLQDQISEKSIAALTKLERSNGNFYARVLNEVLPEGAKDWEVRNLAVSKASAVKALAGGTVEDYVARKLAKHYASIAAELEYVKANDGKLHVEGWSSSAANAIKNGSRWNDRYDSLAQEINNGVEK